MRVEGTILNLTGFLVNQRIRYRISYLLTTGCKSRVASPKIILHVSRSIRQRSLDEAQTRYNDLLHIHEPNLQPLKIFFDIRVTELSNLMRNKYQFIGQDVHLKQLLG